MQDIFKSHYLNNFWGDPESVSGAGSTLHATENIRRVLPTLLKELKITGMADVPCGDMNWMPQVLDETFKHTPKFYYFGGDIVPELIARNRAAFAGLRVHFGVFDLTSDPFPAVDLILCRDVFGHLSNADVKRALSNVTSSGARYLLATTFPEHTNEGDIKTGEWRPLNLEVLWGLGNAIMLIRDAPADSDAEFADKSLGLWALDDI